MGAEAENRKSLWLRLRVQRRAPLFLSEQVVLRRHIEGIPDAPSAISSYFLRCFQTKP